MNLSPNPNLASRHSRRVLAWAAVAATWLVGFALYYYFEPLGFVSEYWNDKVQDTLILLPALATALLGVKLLRHFKPSEPPYRVWFAFMLGWWAWVAGELLGFVYDYFYWNVDYPEFTFIDVCWLAGYAMFGLSLYNQFRLIYRYKQGHKARLYLSLIALGLLLALGLTQWALAAGLGEGYSWLALYLAVIYPVFDLFEGGAALWLFFLFGRGYLGRPWWGLIAFTAADAISIFFWMGGYNWVSDQVYLIMDLSAAVLYVAAYLITALALLSANEHLKRGATIVAPDPVQ